MVGQIQRGATMGHHQHRDRRGEPGDGVEHGHLGFIIKRRRGFIKHQQCRLTQQCPGDGHPLPFATRQTHTPLAQHGVEPVGQSIHEHGGGLPQGLVTLGVCHRAIDRPHQVVAQRARQQQRLLGDVGHMLSPPRQVLTLQHLTGHQHLAPVWLEQSQYQVCGGGLPRTRWPGERRDAAVGNHKVQVAHTSTGAAVGERHIAEFHQRPALFNDQ